MSSVDQVHRAVAELLLGRCLPAEIEAICLVWQRCEGTWNAEGQGTLSCNILYGVERA